MFFVIFLFKLFNQCDAAYGMKAFFQMLDEDPVKILLFGGACPSVTDPIAKTSKFFHLIQVSFRETMFFPGKFSHPNLLLYKVIIC